MVDNIIRLYEHDEKEFKSLGLGTLTDVMACEVTESTNGTYELEMEYPTSGKLYKELKNRRIILSKPNPHDRPQPFRIYTIIHGIDGRCTVKAEHISYDATGITIPPFEGENIDEVFKKINETAVIKHPFKLIRHEDKNNVETKMTQLAPSSIRGLLAGQKGSILDTYKGEYVFDRFDIILMNRRGSNRGLTIRYGKNMTELEHDLNSDKIYTGVYPFYQRVSSVTETDSSMHYQKLYIKNPDNPWETKWLTSSFILESAVALIPIVERVPIKIDVKDDDPDFEKKKAYKDKIVAFKKAELKSGGVTPKFEYIMTVVIPEPLTSDESLEHGKFRVKEMRRKDNNALIAPKQWVIYKANLNKDSKVKNYIYREGKYELYEGEGFYFEWDVEKDGELPPPLFSVPETTTKEVAEYTDLRPKEDEEDDGTIWVPQPGEEEPGEPEDPSKYTRDNGVIYIDGYEDEEEQRIMTLDLTNNFTGKPTQKDLFTVASEYLKKNNLREIVKKTKVSFIRLSDSPEYERFKHLEKVVLGDTVSIIVESLDVKAELNVIKTSYDPITDKYLEIELGTKSNTISDTVMTTGSPISNLENDVDYVDDTAVNHMVAKTITADYIKAQNANLTEAQIQHLEVVKVNIAGMLEASTAVVDEIVARLMKADNAVINDLLTSGELEVAGNIRVMDGSIQLGLDEFENPVTGEIETGYKFTVDRNGNVNTRKGNISGGSINIGNNPTKRSSFTVNESGEMVATGATISGDITSEKIDGVKMFSFDNDIYVESIKSSNGTNTQRVDVLRVDTEMRNNYNSYEIWCIVRLNKPLWNTQNITVEYTYGRSSHVGWGGMELIRTTSRFVLSPKSLKNNQNYVEYELYTGTYISEHDGYIRNPQTYGYTPKWYTETRNLYSTSRLGVNGDFTPRYGSKNNLGMPEYEWQDIYSKNALNITSDRKTKIDISYNMNKYQTFFDNLKPANYRVRGGLSGRTHTGLVAQDVEQALISAGLTTKDLAAVTKTVKDVNNPSNEDDNIKYGIRYSELISILIWQIQEQKKRIDIIEKKK